MDEKRILELMTALGCTREEAIQVIADDDAIDDGEKLFELTTEQKKTAKAMTTTGTKKRTTATKRERKPDEIKRQIVEKIADSLSTYVFTGTQYWNAENISITNVEREISFTIGNDSYSLTLTKHRPPKK